MYCKTNHIKTAVTLFQIKCTIKIFEKTLELLKTVTVQATEPLKSSRKNLSP